MVLIWLEIVATVAPLNLRRVDGQSRSLRFFGLEYATVRPSIFICRPVSLLRIFRKLSFDGSNGEGSGSHMVWYCCCMVRLEMPLG